MSAYDRSLDTPAHRRTAGLGGGALGGTVGLMGGLLLHDGLSAAVAVPLVAALGALAAVLLEVRFGLVEWEPGPGHSYVGAYTPEDSFVQR